MTRTSKLLALALGLSFTACQKKGGPPLAPSVTFVSPVDRAMLTAAAGKVVSGILSIEVTAKTVGINDGVSGNLTVDGADAGTDPVTNATLSFSAVQLTGDPGGTLHVLVVSVDGVTATIKVTVVLGSNGACAVSISPVNESLFNETGNAVQGHGVVEDEDLASPGMQAKITVSVGPPCQDGIAVALNVGTNAALTATLANGVAVFDEVSLPDTPITALQNTSQLLPIEAVAAAGTTNASNDTIHYLVDSQQPTIAITNPADGAIFSQGTSVVVMGFTDINQLAGSPVQVTIADNGINVNSATLNSPGDGGFWENPFVPPLSNNQLVATVEGITGNVATSPPITFTITPTGAICDGGNPTVAFTTPAQGASFNLASDENASEPGFQTPIKVTTSSMTGALEVCSTVAPTAIGATGCGFNAQLFHVGSGTVSGGSATLDSTTLGDDGAAANQTLTAQVIDGTCGMMGQGTVTIAVHAIQPVIESIVVQNDFVSGADAGCVWLNSTNLQNGTAQTTVLVTVDGSDSFADGGPTLTITGTANQSDTAPFTGSGTPSAQVPISLADGTYTATATVTDAWGNTSAPDQIQICVKTSLPTCTLGDTYTNGCFNIQNNSGTGTNGTVPVSFTVTATNADATDGNGNQLDGTATVMVNGGTPTSDPIATAATLTVNSGQGADVYSATVTDPAGNPPAVCTPTSLNLTVSTVAPTFAVSPESGSSVDDAGCEIYTSRDGIQIGIATTDIADGTSITVQATGASGGNSAKTQATVNMASASATLNAVPNGIDTVTASGTDSCGNPGTGSACIDVQATGCDLSLVSPTVTSTDAGESVVFNASQVMSGTVAIELHTSCPTGTQVQFDSTATGGSDQPQDGGVDANGDVTFDLTNLVDGSTGTFTSDISGGESLPTIAYDAKLSVPSATSETPVVGTLEIVANQDNLILDDAGVTSLAIDGGTIIANEPACTTTACADFTVSGISGLGPVDGNGNIGTASLALSFGGGTTNPSPITIANGTTSVTFSAVSMPAVGMGTVTVTLTDNAGNTATETWNVTTDSLQPNAPTLSAAMSDKRTASVQLSWTVPASGGDSATEGYELAYVVNNLQTTAPVTPSESTYAGWTFDPTIVGVNGDAGAMLTHVVSPPFPTFNQYTFELRAIDAVGNRSALTTDATAISVSAADSNAWQTVTINDSADDAGVSDFGYVLRNGDFNGDGKQDLVITAPYQYASNPTPGIVYILNGAADLSKVTFASLTAITLGGTAYDYFGQDAHVADYNGDGTDDLVVGAPYFNAGQGRIDIFFGNNPNGLPANPDVTIYGDNTQTGYFGYSVGAADVNGDGIPDLLVGAPGMGTGSGSVYVFLGTKTWPASATSSDGGVNSPSPTSIISGNPGDGVGARWGTVAIGDINADGDGDFVVGAPGGGGTDDLDAGSGTEYGISGASVLANASISVSSGALFTLIGRNPGFCDPVNFGYASSSGDVAGEPFWGCYGTNAIGNVSFTGGALPDLIVSSDYYSSVYLYEMTATGPTIPAAYTTSDQTGALGWSMVAPDLNGDGLPDLLAGENGGNPNVFLYLNSADGGLPSTAGGELFGSNAFGYGLAAGDFQGISKPDIAVSDWESVDVIIYY